MSSYSFRVADLIDSTETYEVFAIRYSERLTSTDEAYFRNGVYGEGSRPFTMAYFFWVIRGATGTFLFDSGFSSDAATHRSRTFLIEPLHALKEMSLTPEDVDALYLSHLHFDHTGHLDQFPRAEVFVESQEFDFWTQGCGRKKMLAASSESTDLLALEAMHRRGRARFLEGTSVVQPGIVSIHVGGHTPGQHILSVNTVNGPVVLASDALHYYDELYLDRPFALFTDVEDMYRGYELLRQLESAGVKVVAGHDMAVIERYGVEDSAPFLTRL